MTLSISPNYEVIPLFNKGIFVININIKKISQKTSPPPIAFKPRCNKDFRHFQGGGIFHFIRHFMIFPFTQNHKMIPSFTKRFGLSTLIKKDFEKTSPPPIAFKPRCNKAFRHFQDGGIF